VLAQGTTSSGFGNFDSDAYLRDVFRALAGIGIWGQSSAPRIQRVVLTGHSGAGGPIAQMMSEPNQPRLPSSLGEVALFDAINGENEFKSVRAWVTDHLNRDLSSLTASGMTTTQQLSYLNTSLRFRAYYTNGSYAPIHVTLLQAIDNWFNQHAAALGGKSSNLFLRLYNNYRVIAVGHGEHEVIMGRNDRLVDALNALPSLPANVGVGSNSSLNAPTGPSQQGGVSMPPASNGGAPAPIQRQSTDSISIDSLLMDH
jgi:hypothetical protein